MNFNKIVNNALLGCENKASIEGSASNDLNYRIIKDTKMRGIKRSIEVNLNKKISKTMLKDIALILKQSDSKSYQRTFIGYFLEGEDKSQGYWATTHFNPNLEVKILGLSKEDEIALTKKAIPKPERNIIGSWLDSRPGVGARMTLFYMDENLFLESVYSDGSSGVTEVNETRQNGGKRIDDKESNKFGEYFIINKAGKLEFWSENGNYYTAKTL